MIFESTQWLLVALLVAATHLITITNAKLDDEYVLETIQDNVEHWSVDIESDEWSIFRDELCMTFYDDSSIGRELYTTNGETLELVSDLNSGGSESHSNPAQLTNVNDEFLYFVAYTPATGHELWVYNGKDKSIAKGSKIVNSDFSIARNNL